MRGEYTHETRASVTELGSPPLARGIHSSTCPASTGKGITPACAGNTVFFFISAIGEEDHPRLRGEYSRKCPTNHILRGSPPLARGIPIKAKITRSSSRITPACAGNTRNERKNRVLHGDHPRLRGEYRQQSLMLSRYRGSPRLRGEYMSAASNITSAPGSPPLARGIQLIPGRRVSAIGITPACAGNTRRLTMAGCQYRDHPRLRGEYSSIPSTSASI